MARTPVEILRDAGVRFAVHEHVPVASVAEILEALPFPASEHVKTLAVTADGRVMAHGTPADLGRTDSGWARQFLDGLPDGPVQFHYPARDYAEDLLAG